jgi:hypothetical protein
MPAQRVSKVLMLSSKMKQRSALAAAGGGQRELHGNRRLAGARAPTKSVLVPFSRPPPSRSSSASMPLASFSRDSSAAMLGRDQARKDHEAAAHDLVVVESAAEVPAAILHDHQAPARRAVIGIELFQAQHGMGNALHLQVVLGRGHVVEHEHRAVAPGEKTA